MVDLLTALDSGVVPRDYQIEARHNHHRSNVAVPEAAIDVTANVRPVPHAVPAYAIDPPGEAVVAVVVALVVPAAYRALAFYHLGLCAFCPRYGDRQGTAHRQLCKLGADKLFVLPFALSQIEQTETRKITRRNRQSSGPILRAEGHKGGAVLALEQIGQARTKHLAISLLPSRSIDFQKQGVEEQGHVPVAVIEGLARTFGDPVARDLIAQMPPGYLAVLVSETFIKRFQPRLKVAHQLIETFQLAGLNGLEQEVRIDGLDRRGDIHSPARIAPGIDHIPAPHDAPESPRIIAHLFELLHIQPGVARPFHRPRPTRIDQPALSCFGASNI